MATDVLRTAGKPHALRLTSDRKSLAADGRSLCFVTAEVVDACGVLVPGAAPSITFDAVHGSRLRVTMRSRHPGEVRGALRISRLEVPAR